MTPSFRTSLRRLLACTMAAAVVCAPVSAEVMSSSANGFVLEHVVEVAATPANAYRAAIGNIESWWD